jgi:hypothetical protein
MMAAPVEVSAKRLRELHIRVVKRGWTSLPGLGADRLSLPRASHPLCAALL